MKVKFFLVVNDRGTTRTNKTKPDLKLNEVSIAMNLEIPDSVFKRPQLEATIQLAEKDMPVQHIPVEMQDNLRQALEKAAGVHVKLEIIQPEA